MKLISSERCSANTLITFRVVQYHACECIYAETRAHIHVSTNYTCSKGYIPKRIRIRFFFLPTIFFPDSEFVNSSQRYNAQMCRKMMEKREREREKMIDPSMEV